MSSSRRFLLAEIKKATDDFHEASIIETTEFWDMYKGILDDADGKKKINVTVKRLNKEENLSREFRTEITSLSKFHHDNLVSLLGYCSESGEMILVYEYAQLGSLAKNLAKSSLSWEQRLKICIGGARGLKFLHNDTGVSHRIIHRDVKTDNILLDENLVAKISGFGLCKVGPANQPRSEIATQVRGTSAYIDPEYMKTGKLTRRADVYAFGVVLCEVLCGRAAFDETLEKEQQSLGKWAKKFIKDGKVDEIVDRRLDIEQIGSDCLKAFADVAGKCLDDVAYNRPDMAQVVEMLEAVLKLQEASKTC